MKKTGFLKKIEKGRKNQENLDFFRLFYQIPIHHILRSFQRIIFLKVPLKSCNYKLFNENNEYIPQLNY